MIGTKFLININKKNLVVFFLLLLISSFYFYNLSGWLIHDDEGGYLYQAWRMSEGETPYRDFYSPKEPLFLFTGYIIFKLFGPNILWVRMFTTLVTILTSYFIFLIGKRIYNSDKTAISSAILYLSLSVVYSQARLYRSDAHVVFFSTLGLFLFIRAWQDNRKFIFVYSGIFFALSLGYKFSSTLGIAALLLFILYEAAVEKKFSIVMNSFIPFVCALLLIIGFFSFALYNIAPQFLTCLIGHQVRQPELSSLRLSTTMVENLKEFLLLGHRQYGFRSTHPWLIISSLPSIIRYLFLKKDLKKIFTFYILNVCVLLFNPYPGQILRYLLYFMPIAVLVFTDFIFYSFLPSRSLLVKMCGWIILIFVLVKVFIPSLIKDCVLFNAKENGTLALAKYIRGRTNEQDYIVNDYGDILFHAKRKTTPLMAGMSKSAVDNGVITSEKLIKELEDYQVKMILIHKEGGIPHRLGAFFETPFEPHHFASLINSKDGLKFIDYIQKKYQLVDTFNRTGQIYDIYIKK